MTELCDKCEKSTRHRYLMDKKYYGPMVSQYFNKMLCWQCDYEVTEHIARCNRDYKEYLAECEWDSKSDIDKALAIVDKSCEGIIKSWIEKYKPKHTIKVLLNDGYNMKPSYQGFGEFKPKYKEYRVGDLEVCSGIPRYERGYLIVHLNPRNWRGLFLNQDENWKWKVACNR